MSLKDLGQVLAYNVTVNVCHDSLTQTLPLLHSKPRPRELGACSSSPSKFRSQVGVGTQVSWTLGPCSSPVGHLIWSPTRNLDSARPWSLVAAQLLSRKPTCGWLPSLPTCTKWKQLFKVLQPTTGFASSQLKALALLWGLYPPAAWWQLWPSRELCLSLFPWLSIPCLSLPCL